MQFTRGPESSPAPASDIARCDENWLIDLTSALLDLSKHPNGAHIENVLRELCTLTRSEKCLIFQLSDDGRFFDRTYGWYQSSVEKHAIGIDQVPAATVQWIVDRLEESRTLAFESLTELPKEAFGLKAILETRGTKAVICAGICDGDNLSAIVGCVRTTEGEPWTDLDRTLVSSIAASLSKHPDLLGRSTSSSDPQGEASVDALRQAPDPYLITDRDGSTVWMNNACVRFFNLSENERSFNILLDQAIHELGFDETVEQVFHEGRSIRLNLEIHRLQSPTGLLGRTTAGTLELVLYPLHDVASHVTGVVAGFRDITGTEEQLSHLRTGEERLRLIFNNSREMIVMIDSQGKILMANPSCLSFFGFCPSDLEALVKRVHPGDRRSAREALNAASESRDWAGDFIWRCENANGEFVDFESSVTSITVHREHYSLLQCRDITSRMQIEEELQATNEKLAREEQVLEEKNSALKEILLQIGDEKEQIKRQIQANVDRLIVPVLQTLYERADDTNKSYLHFLESCLNDITSPFINRLEKQYAKLSPREVEICKMIKSGFSSKDIANTLNISLLTVHKFRQQIRNKLGVNNKQVNLVGFLNSM
jgi:PAS domain S-box-containing protein